MTTLRIVSTMLVWSFLHQHYETYLVYENGSSDRQSCLGAWR